MPVKCRETDDHDYILQTLLKLSCGKDTDGETEEREFIVKLCSIEDAPVNTVKHATNKFVHVGRRQETSQDESRTTTSSLEDSSSDLEQSLETPVQPDIILPLSTSEARWLATAYNKFAKTNKLLPMWIRCHGDLEYIICEYEDSMRITTISQRGPVSVKELESLSSLVSHHCWGQDGVKLSREGFTHFDILESSSSCNDTTIHGYEGGLSVDFMWEPVTNVLQSPPLDAQAVLHAVPKCGDARSPIYSLHEELSRIQGFIDGISCGTIQWPAATNLESITQSVMDLFKEVERGDETRQTDSNDTKEDVDSKLQTATLIFEDRIDLDFTESLWHIFKDCSSYGQLVEGLQYTFNVLQKGNIKPMVHSNNQTTLAKLVCESYYSRMVAPPLTDTLPLRIVAEIGLEKMTRDFINIFLTHDWASLQHLQPFVSDDQSDMSSRLACLQKLEITLELLALLKLYMNLPQAELYRASRQALAYFTSHDVQTGHVFDLPIKTTLLAGTLQSCSPKEWRLRLSSEDSDTLYQLSKLPLLEISQPCEDASNSQISEETEDYFVTVTATNKLQSI